MSYSKGNPSTPMHKNTCGLRQDRLSPSDAPQLGSSPSYDTKKTSDNNTNTTLAHLSYADHPLTTLVMNSVMANNDDALSDMDTQVEEERLEVEASNDTRLGVLNTNDHEHAPPTLAVEANDAEEVDVARKEKAAIEQNSVLETDARKPEEKNESDVTIGDDTTTSALSVEAKVVGSDLSVESAVMTMADEPTSEPINPQNSQTIFKSGEEDDEVGNEEDVTESREVLSLFEAPAERVIRTSTDDIGVSRSQSGSEDAAASAALTNRRSSEPTRTAVYIPDATLAAAGLQNIGLPLPRFEFNSADRLSPPTLPTMTETSSNHVATANSMQRILQQQQRQESTPSFPFGMMTPDELLAQLSGLNSSRAASTARAQPQDGTDARHNPVLSTNHSGLPPFDGAANDELPRTALQQLLLQQQTDVAPRRPRPGSTPLLPPLQPQPVSIPSPPQRQRRTVTMDVDNDSDYDGDAPVPTAAAATASYSRFRCPICFEYMSDPASCGFCSTRFCWECLCRVAVRLDHAHRSAFGSAKCPTCREIFSIGTIRRDLELKEEIQGQVVSCPFSGCGEVMPLHELAGHETTCTYCTLKCRFASVGCSWVGRRSELTTHETSECRFYPLRQWIEQTRQTSHDHAQQLVRAHEEITSLAAMVEAMETSEYLVRQQVKCPNNPLHLVEYTVVSMCTTPLLIFYSRDVWRYFHHSEQARGTVFNFLSMLPTQFLLMTVTACGYRLFVKQMSMSSTADWNKEQLDRVVDVFLSFSLTLLWILLLSAMYVDGQSSLDWRVFQAPGFLLDNMMNHVVSLGMLAAHFAVWQFLDSSRVGWMIWGWTIFASTFVPAVVSSISQAMNRTDATWQERPPSPLIEVPNPSNVLLTGRAGNAVMFGLRYGVLAASLGIIPTFDATILLFALRDIIPQVVSYHWAYAEVNEPLLAWIPKFSPLAQVVAAVRLAMEARLWFTHPSDSTFYVSLLATGCLLLVNQITLRLSQVGALLGSAVASTWTSFDQAGAAPERDYSAFGMTVFGLWSCSLAAIAMSTSHK